MGTRSISDHQRGVPGDNIDYIGMFDRETSLGMSAIEGLW